MIKKLLIQKSKTLMTRTKKISLTCKFKYEKNMSTKFMILTLK